MLKDEWVQGPSCKYSYKEDLGDTVVPSMAQAFWAIPNNERIPVLAFLICLEVLQVSCLLQRPVRAVFCRQHGPEELELPALCSEQGIVALDFKVMLLFSLNSVNWWTLPVQNNRQTRWNKGVRFSISSKWQSQFNLICKCAVQIVTRMSASIPHYKMHIVA